MSWLPLLMDNIPAEVRALGWVGFRAELGDDGKWKKPPYQIGRPRESASNADPMHWRTEGDVREVRALAPELFTGYGIALTEGLVFIDVDHVRDPATGAIDEWALQLVRIFDSWAEASVSGEGVHIFCFGRLPGSGIVGYLDGDPTRKVEVYDRGRFAYLTGHALEPVRPLAERQRLVDLLARHVRPAGPHAATTSMGRGEAPIPEGQRNDALFRIARGFVLHGLRGSDLARALRAVNHRRCVPPLPDSEVAKLARHAEQLPDRRPA